MLCLKPSLLKRGTALQENVPEIGIKQAQEVFHYKSVTLQTGSFPERKLSQLEKSHLLKITDFLVDHTGEPIGEKTDAKI